MGEPVPSLISHERGPCPRPDLAVAVDTLSRRLRSTRTATQALLAWCEEHGLEDGPILVDRDLAHPPAALDTRGRAELAPAGTEPVRHRRVELRRGALALARADNWYMPARLPVEQQRLLASTDLPFGTVVAPLSPSRRTYLVAGEQLPPGFVLEHRAVVLDAAGRPLAVVRELYRAALLGR